MSEAGAQHGTRRHGPRLTRAAGTLAFLIERLDGLPGRAVPAKGNYLPLALGVVLVKANRLAQGIVVLTQHPHPFGDAALVLARSILELFWTAAFLVHEQGREEYWAHRYLHQWIVSQRNALKAMTIAERRQGQISDDYVASGAAAHRALREQLRDRLMQENSDLTRRTTATEVDREVNEWGSHRDWNGIPVREMVLRIGREHEHNTTYAFLSQYSHAGSESAPPFVATLEAGTADLVADPDPDDHLGVSQE